jgi:uncharacterized RDD family membrane protein YckC
MEQETYFSEIQQPETESPVWIEYASTGQRFANYIIDLIIFYIVMFGMAVLLGLLLAATGRSFHAFSNDAGSKLLEYLVIYAFYVIFYTFCEGASHGRTIGKLITKTKAVRYDDTDITWTDALMRSLCRIVPLETFSALGGYPWHDKWSNTKVIKIS